MLMQLSNVIMPVNLRVRNRVAPGSVLLIAMPSASLNKHLLYF